MERGAEFIAKATRPRIYHLIKCLCLFKNNIKLQGTTIKMSNTKTRGGARPGAGRPSREKPRKMVSMRLEPDIADRFRDIAQQNDLSQSELLTKWVERSGTY